MAHQTLVAGLVVFPSENGDVQARILVTDAMGKSSVKVTFI